LEADPFVSGVVLLLLVAAEMNLMPSDINPASRPVLDDGRGGKGAFKGFSVGVVESTKDGGLHAVLGVAVRQWLSMRFDVTDTAAAGEGVMVGSGGGVSGMELVDGQGRSIRLTR
jgi:hypothetical protein